VNQVELARATMGTSLAFHIVFAALGVGMPLLLVVAEGLGLWRRDAVWMDLARRWSRAFGLLFAIGAVSGTVLSFELGLLWPRFMALSGSMIGLPFTAEGFAFFLEAIFLGLYLYGWDRLSPVRHWLCGLPIAVSGAASALFVVMVNAWMNSPAGFRLQDGAITQVDPLAAALNPSVSTEDPHMLFSAYTVTGFLVAAVYAAGILRGRGDEAHRRGLALGMAMGLVAIALAGFWGDLSARFIFQAQPAKFAAMEGLFHTTRGAPITIGGLALASQQRVVAGLEIPYGLSLLAAFDPHAVVRGLDSIARQDWPDPALVHSSFDAMVAFSGLAGVAALVFWALAWRRRRIPTNRWLLWCLVAAGPATVVAMEAGWFVTEFGRQPWTVYGVLRTSDAATSSPGVGPTFALFLVIYVALAAITARLLLELAKRRRAAA
jgi:cytochrome d ubiquinol oxidase subunit I